MDLTLPEPPVTSRLRAHIDGARSRLDDTQRAAIDEWDHRIALDSAVLLRLRQTVDAEQLERLARRLAYRAKRMASRVEHAREVRPLMNHAFERPAAVSAILWRLLGTDNSLLASHLIQIIRERAELPALRRVIESSEPTRIEGVPQVAWFADRQLEDACAWMENVPPRAAGTLLEIEEGLARNREWAGRVQVLPQVPFVKRAASLFLHLAARGLDPLGYELGSDAQIDVDPPMDQRIEIAQWARGAGHHICLRGHMLTLTIPVKASAPSALQLIASEPGVGICGGLMWLLRLRGPLCVPSLSSAPAMLWLPEESIDERGARFERWLNNAYPRATSAWRAWS